LKLRWRLGLPLELFRPFKISDLRPSDRLIRHQRWREAVKELRRQEMIYFEYLVQQNANAEKAIRLEMLGEDSTNSGKLTNKPSKR